MSNTHEIKRRITSIRSTAQITKALQMVSASRMAKAQQKAIEAGPYSLGLYEIINMIGNLDDYESPYLKSVKEVKNVVIVIIGPTRGFVGPLTTSLTLEIDSYLDELRQDHPSAKVKAISLYRVAGRIAKNLGLEVSHNMEAFPENPTSQDLQSLKKVLIEGFNKQDFDEIHIAYSHFINTISQKPTVKKILPLSSKELEDKSQPKSTQKPNDFEFEPGKKAILEQLLPEYFENQVYTSLLEALASEHSARMVAMQNATDNAIELRENLKLQYNKSRQTKITNEIIDIVAGSQVA